MTGNQLVQPCGDGSSGGCGGGEDIVWLARRKSDNPYRSCHYKKVPG